MSRLTLIEHLQPSIASVTLLTEGTNDGCKYLEGIAIQGDVENRNGRIYPKEEIARAVADMQQRISEHGPIAGECDHPDNLVTSLERTSHFIERIKLSGSNGIAKFKIVPVGLGAIVSGLIQYGLKVGVSSRGSGNVDSQGRVSDFEIHTIDMVANPSAPSAYPQTIRESVEESASGREAMTLANVLRHDEKAQQEFLGLMKHFTQELRKGQR